MAGRAAQLATWGWWSCMLVAQRQVGMIVMLVVHEQAGMVVMLVVHGGG